ncbi:unnamed protein product [Parnassius apollo]|uniref:(apollo) hypothetical protein n=1 Tax=Parnassius apollo TaxID=110799 RepID=A0A8S3W390_PARAO|nr:unnamed protein product [Parnassius apollo]
MGYVIVYIDKEVVFWWRIIGRHYTRWSNDLMSNWRANKYPSEDFIHILYADDDDLSEDSKFEPDNDEI